MTNGLRTCGAAAWPSKGSGATGAVAPLACAPAPSALFGWRGPAGSSVNVPFSKCTRLASDAATFAMPARSEHPFQRPSSACALLRVCWKRRTGPGTLSSVAYTTNRSVRGAGGGGRTLRRRAVKRLSRLHL